MAYRRYWRRYWRRYYRGRYANSYAKTRMTRNFKASANNMTQGGTFNISSRQTAQCIFDTVPSTGSDNVSKSTQLNIPSAITSSAMHIQLSNVFDQYRVERLVIRIRPIGDASQTPSLTQPSLLFTAVDRSGFNANATIDQYRTYGSYKETQISGAKDISPTHTVYVSQSNLVEWTTWSDTKSMVSFPSVALGVFFAHLPANTIVNLAVEFDFQIRYRGVRLDTSSVATRLQ